MNLEVCRICGTTKALKNIFSEGNDELVEQIRLCANIQIDVNDCLPKFVCIECENGLAFSYRLRKRGEETEKKLRQDLLLLDPCSTINEDSSFINTEEDNNSSNMIEEYCDEEMWINDEGPLHSNKEESFIERVSESNEEDNILHDIPEDSYNNIDELWIEEKDEFLTKIEESEEFLEETDIQTVEEGMFNVTEIIDKSNVEHQVEVPPDIQPKKNELECEICFEVFEKKSHYQQHVKIHTEKRFHCAVCDKWFTYRYRYDEHMKNHLTSDRAFPCTQCHKSYTNQGNMERHVRSAHKLERKFQCYECGASFGRPDILKMHMAMHTDKRTIECEVCKKNFKTNQSLHYHMRVHQQKPERPKNPQRRVRPKSQQTKQTYLCDQCDKVSRHRTTHLNHMRTHTGEKPFKCSTCEKAFRTTHARSNHELLHTDKRPHTCKSCGLSFRQTSHLKSHQLTHTGDKRHVCNVCQKAFAMRSNLVVHLRIHTGEMPYACNKCTKKFLLSNQFKRHKLIHMGDNDNEEGLKTDEQFCKENEIEIGGEFHDSQISLYIDDIIDGNPERFEEEDIVVSE